MGRIIQIGIRSEPLCTTILNCFTMISDYIRLWVISHPWNMRKTKGLLNTTVHQSQYTSTLCVCPIPAEVGIHFQGCGFEQVAVVNP